MDALLTHMLNKQLSLPPKQVPPSSLLSPPNVEGKLAQFILAQNHQSNLQKNTHNNIGNYRSTFSINTGPDKDPDSCSEVTQPSQWLLIK